MKNLFVYSIHHLSALMGCIPRVQALDPAFKEITSRICKPSKPLVLLSNDDGSAVTAGYLMVAIYVAGLFNSYRII